MSFHDANQLVGERYSRGLAKRAIDELEVSSNEFMVFLHKEFRKLAFNEKSLRRKHKRIKKNYDLQKCIGFGSEEFSKNLQFKDKIFWIAPKKYVSKNTKDDCNSNLGISVYETLIKKEKINKGTKSCGVLPRLNLSYHSMKRFYQRTSCQNYEEVYSAIKNIFSYSLFIINIIRDFDDQILGEDSDISDKLLFIPYGNDLFLGNIKMINIKDGLSSGLFFDLYFDCRTFIASKDLQVNQRYICSKFMELADPCIKENKKPKSKDIAELFDLMENHPFKSAFVE